jgi:hypothetical protein
MADREETGKYSCRVCSYGVSDAEAVACARCLSPHHRDCWEFTGGCSLYGCGCTDQVPFESVQQGLAVTNVEIDASSADRGQLEIQTRRLLARFQVAARASIRTVAAGAFGGAITLGLACVLLGPGTALGVKAITIIMGIGLLHGLLAPFLAPLQLQYRRSMIVTSWILLCASLFVHFHGAESKLTVIMGMTAATVLASTMAEWAFGRRSRLGERLGKGAVGLRYLSTGLLSAALFDLAILIVGSSNLLQPSEFAIVAALAILCGGHPLERGKRLLEASFDPPRLPESGN